MTRKASVIIEQDEYGFYAWCPEPRAGSVFQAIIRRSLPCFIRKPRGLDVYAACGQLKRMETADLTQIQ